jgi:hypothetical protein
VVGGGLLVGGREVVGRRSWRGVDWNWARKLFTAAEVQVLAPLVAVDPSTGMGVWSPSNAAHCTGNPARHPE